MIEKKVKIIILGANGQLGKELAINLSLSANILALTKADCSITNYDLLEEKISTFNPDFIINAAAYTNVDAAENFFNIADEINNRAVRNLAELSNKYSFNFIHFSTDYIFNSKNEIPIAENNIKNPINKYGYSKLLGEESIIEIADNFIILRVSWVYGTYGNNFPKKILSLAKEKDVIDVVDDQTGSPTPTYLISNVVEKLIAKYKNQPCKNNIFHLSPEGSCSWFDVANYILNFIKSAPKKNSYQLKKIKSVPSSNFKTPANRPKYSYLSNNNLKKFLDIEIESWDTYLNNFLTEELK